jgi:hypothetical protein
MIINNMNTYFTGDYGGKNLVSQSKGRTNLENAEENT